MKVRRGGREEIPYVQGNRNPSKTVGVKKKKKKDSRCCKRASESRHTETIITEN